jgi:hypothetical protein
MVLSRGSAVGLRLRLVVLEKCAGKRINSLLAPHRDPPRTHICYREHCIWCLRMDVLESIPWLIPGPP